MDRTIIAVHRMLDALAAATYDVGILSDRGMFPGHKPKHKQVNGLFPFVLLRGSSGRPFTRAEAFGLEATCGYQLAQEQNRRTIDRCIGLQMRFPHTGARYSKLSVERFRALPRYRDRPAAADIAFCISALSLQMPEDAIMRALEDDYLSRDPNPSRRAAYIRRTLSKARLWTRL